MAKYISNWSGSYPNSAVSNSAAGFASMVSNADDLYNAFSDDGPTGGIYQATPTYISGYVYNAFDFEIYGSGFNTNVRSGPGNLNSAISGNSATFEGPAGRRNGARDGKKIETDPFSGVQGEGGLGGVARG